MGESMEGSDTEISPALQVKGKNRWRLERGLEMEGKRRAREGRGRQASVGGSGEESGREEEDADNLKEDAAAIAMVASCVYQGPL